MTSKERASLKSQAVKIEPILQIGKAGITPELTEAVSETFNTRELTKIHILQSCTEDGRTLAHILADRTGSETVQVIGRMIILYKRNDELHQKKAKEAEATNSKLMQRAKETKNSKQLQKSKETKNNKQLQKSKEAKNIKQLKNREKQRILNKCKNRKEQQSNK